MRSKAASVVVGSKLYFFGGLGAGHVGAMWSFDLSTRKWNCVCNRSMGKTPPGRSGHTMVADDEGRLWLFGGQAGTMKGVDLKKTAATSLRVSGSSARLLCA